MLRSIAKNVCIAKVETERVAIMKRVWAGQKVTDSVLPVGPPPLQTGGPRLLVGTIGPKTVRGAAQWAQGLAGTTSWTANEFLMRVR